MNISGIYKIQSVVNPERVYIGSAINISKRKSDHFTRLNRNVHENPRLQNHYNKHGKEDLIFSILLGCAKEDLIKQEQFFIDSLNPYFNILKIAGSKLGYKVTDQTKLILRNCNLGKLMSEETKKKISESNKGKHSRIVSIETRRKLSIALKGRKMSPETILKRKLTVTEQKRHPHSEETKRKIGEKSKGRIGGYKGKKMSDHLRTKLLSIHLGSKHTEEHKKKIGDAIRGRKMSDEFKQKIKDSWIERKLRKTA